jgi:hypothetical protein
MLVNLFIESGEEGRKGSWQEGLRITAVFRLESDLNLWLPLNSRAKNDVTPSMALMKL